MATSSSSSCSSSKSTIISPRHPPIFTPIEEGNEEDEYSQGRSSFKAESTPSENRVVAESDFEYKHHPTPLHTHSPAKKGKGSSRKPPENGKLAGEDDRGVLCNKCRPSNREKISVVPLDNNGVRSLTSPHGLFKSVLTMVKKSPNPKSSLSEDGSSGSRDEQWKIAVAELSHKLIQATRKRDEAIVESSRLKFSMTELEKKLNKLEIYCHNLKSELEICSKNNTAKPQISKSIPVNVVQRIKFGEEDRVIEHFLVLVSDSRSSVRILSRSLTLQLRQIGTKVYDRIALLLQPYDIKISSSRNPRGLLLYLEALLNRAFFEDFESIGFQKSSCNVTLNPIDRCEANFALFNRLQALTWDEVLSKGTRFYSEEFSKFCDRKMSEIVAMLGWNRAWPEPLLQAFFGASKAVWLVHLLANSLHPSLPIFRVDKGMRFDSVYMEDMGGDKARKLVPAMVRIMVTPGFYVYDNVVKCKVICRYNNNHVINVNDATSDQKGLTPSPT